MASTVKHLRSSTASKRPTASGLAEGQLAINTASGTPGLFLKDSAGTVVKVGPVHVGASAPNAVPAGSAGNSTGELWVNNSTTIHGLNYYTGSAFVNLTPSGTATVAGLVELATNAETQAGTDTVRAVTPSGLQSKVSNSTSTTSSTTIASSTAVKAAYDLADAALPKAGGTVTGALEIGTAGSLVFEGSSADSFETTLAVVNPTADRTITLPNVTGTVITTGDSGTVTSAMIADLNIVNADIDASAAIALSKLATGALPSGITVASANIVNSTIVNDDISLSAAITDTKLATISTVGKVSNSATTATSGNTASAIVARDASGNFTAGTITANLTGTASNVTTNADLTGHITSVGNAAVLGSFTSAQLAAALTNETGTGAAVFATSPTLVTPILGTPTSGNLANCTFPTLNQSTTGNAATATNLSSNRTFALTGEATGSVSSNLSSGASISVVIASGVIDNDNISGTAAIALSKLATGALPSGITVASANIVDSTIVNADISASAAIADTKLATISTAGKVSGSAITSGTIATNGELQITNNVPAIRLTESDGTATNSQTVLLKSGDEFSIGTRSSAGVALSSDYIIPSNASGATDHVWRIGNIEKASLDGSGLTVVNDLTISDKIIHAGDTNTAIRFPAADTVTVETNGAERTRVDSSGRLLVGASATPPAVETIVPKFVISSADSVTGAQDIAIYNYQNAGGFGRARVGPKLLLGNSRSGTNGSLGGIVLNNEVVGNIRFAGDDGSAFITAAEILAEVDGTPGANDMPGRLIFSTTADGSASPTEAMRINNAQELLIGYTADNGAYKLQVNSQIFATSATVATSDGRYKENVATLNGCIDLVNALRPVSFDWKPQQDITRIDEDGNSVLVREGHNFPDGKQVGFIAQEVQEVLADRPWLDSVIKQNVRPAIEDADGNELAPEEEFFGIAEGNLTAVLTAALQEAIAMIGDLEARIAALEA